jgi:hypothetical protein
MFQQQSDRTLEMNGNATSDLHPLDAGDHLYRHEMRNNGIFY